MIDLLDAIIDKFDADSGQGGLYDALGGRLYFDEAPQDPTFPYGAFKLVSDTHEATFTTGFENVLVQFDIFSEASGVSEAGEAEEDLWNLFDECALTIDNYTHVYMHRDFSTGPFRADDVWQVSTQYRVLAEKS